MAKRRNAKLKTTTAVAESEQPTPIVEGPAPAAPLAAVDEPAPIEAISETPVAAEAPAPIDAANSAPESPSVVPATAAKETPAVDVAGATAAAIETQSPGEATPEPSAVGEVQAAETPVATAAAPIEEAPTDAATVEAATNVEPTEAAPQLVTVSEPVEAADAVVATEPAAAIARSEAARLRADSAADRLRSDAATDAQPAHRTATIIPIQRHREFLARVATIAMATALGVIVGSLTTSALLPGAETVTADTAQPDVPRATAASVDKLAAEVATLKEALAASAAMAPQAPAAAATVGVDALGRDIALLKASFGESEIGANARLIELVAQVNRTEKAEADLAARLNRIEKPAVSKADISPEITGSIKADTPPVAEDWVLWRVYDGRAVVQGRRGLFDVSPGADLPDLGVVREITQRDGRWVVITQNGMIVETPRHRLG
jgi:hypothetical protein